MSSPVRGIVGADAVPDESLSRTTLPSIDYVDLFGARFDAQASPEGWARALFGDVPTPGERLIWRGLLGLRLQPPGAHVVAGWAVTGRGPDWIRLEAESDALVANLVVEAHGDSTTLTTALHYRSRLGALQWRVLAPVHRLLAPMLFSTPDQRLRNTEERSAP